MFITPADIDVKIRVYLRDERILTYGSVGVARCWLHVKSGFFFTQNDLRNHCWTTTTIIHIIFFSIYCIIMSNFYGKIEL